MTPQDLIAAFETLADAPDGTARLRELVLQLAVRGKLVAQDPSDEPASSGVARVRNEKGPLLKARVRGRPKVPRVPEGWEQTFDLPSGWSWARLDDTGEYINGRAFKPKDWGDTGIPIIRIQNLTNPSKPFNYAQGDFKEKFLVKDGDILVSWSATLEAFVWDRGDAVLNQHIFRVVPDERVVMRGFLYHLCRQTIREMAESEKAHGLVMKHINRGPFLSHVVALPPLAEQHRIVAKVDALMGLLDRLEAARDARDTTRASLRDAALAALSDAEDTASVGAAWTRIAEHMDDLFTDPADVAPLRQTILQLAVRGRLVPQDPSDEPAAVLLERIAAEKARLVKEKKIRKPKVLPPIEADEVPFDVPEGWEWTRLGALLERGLSNGTSPKAVAHETSIKTLKLSATTQGRFDGRHFKYLDVTPEKAAPYLLKHGDLLIQRSNTKEYVGMAALYDGPDDLFVFPDLMMRGKPTSEISDVYLHRSLISPHSRQWFGEQASGTSKSMVKLSQPKVLSTLIPVPPLAEQHRIVAKVDALMALCDDLEARLTAARTTRGAFAAAAVHHLDA